MKNLEKVVVCLPDRQDGVPHFLEVLYVLHDGGYAVELLEVHVSATELVRVFLHRFQSIQIGYYAEYQVTRALTGERYVPKNGTEGRFCWESVVR